MTGRRGRRRQQLLDDLLKLVIEGNMEGRIEMTRRRQQLLDDLLKQVIEGKMEGRIEMTGRRGRRRQQLLDDLEEKRECLKEEALDRTPWRTCFGRGCGPVVRETAVGGVDS